MALRRRFSPVLPFSIQFLIFYNITHIAGIINLYISDNYYPNKLKIPESFAIDKNSKGAKLWYSGMTNIPLYVIFVGIKKMESEMKRITFIVLLLATFALAACGSMPAINIGNSGESIEEEMELQEIVPEATEAVLPEESKYFRDEFDEDINEDWGLKIISGLEKQLIWSQINGKFRIETLPPNDVNYIFLNKKHTYDDVVITAEVENAGPLTNTLSLICRATEAGWYEFRISPSGYYELLRYDQYRKDDGENPYTNFVEKQVGSTKIVGGLEKNEFSLSCEGDVISAFINGEQLYWQKRPLAIEDDTYSEGTVGFGFLGYSGKEYDVTFNWIDVTKP